MTEAPRSGGENLARDGLLLALRSSEGASGPFKVSGVRVRALCLCLALLIVSLGSRYGVNLRGTAWPRITAWPASIPSPLTTPENRGCRALTRAKLLAFSPENPVILALVVGR